MQSRDMRRRMTKPPINQDKNNLARRPFLYGMSIIILVIIVVAFVGLPIFGRLGGRQGKIVFGTYAGREIRYVAGNYFAEQYDSVASQLRDTDQSGDLYSQLLQAWRYAYNQTVFHTAILVKAEESGIWLTGNRVNDSLVENGPYSVGGVFDRERYAATSSTEKTRIQKLRKDELTQEQFLLDHFRMNLQSSVEKEFIKAMTVDERRFTFVEYDFTDYPEANVLSYGLGNREIFQKIQLSRITVTASEAEAERIRDMALSGTGSFADLARSYSKGFYAEKGGDMGWQHYHQIRVLFVSEDPVKALFNMREGDVSEVFPTGSSWVFFRCDADPVSPDFEDPETIDIVKTYIEQNDRGVIEEYLIGQGEEFKTIAEEEGFIEASLKMDLFPPKETDYFPITYGDALPKSVQVLGDNAETLSAASTNEFFFQTLFTLSEGEISEPILLNERIFVMMLEDQRKAPEEDLENMDDVLEYLSSYYLDRDLSNFVIRDELYDDFFLETFYSAIASPQP